MNHLFLYGAGAVGVIIIAVIAVNIWGIRYGGRPVPVPDIPRQEQTLGQGPALRLVVMGDSTTISQGGDYDRGYAVAAARYLARDHAVTWKNVGLSGARADAVAGRQLDEAKAFKPDVVLVGVGANDVTHLTPVASVERSLRKIIADLRATNPEVKIVFTGSPAMGTVPRLPQPARWLAGQRTQALNRMVARLAQTERVAFARVAEKTGPTFRDHPELFAADKFHPTTAGYEVWVPVIVEALAI